MPETEKIASAQPGASLVTIMYPTARDQQDANPPVEIRLESGEKEETENGKRYGDDHGARTAKGCDSDRFLAISFKAECMCRQNGKGRVGRRDSKKCARDGIDKGVGDKSGKHRPGESKRAEKRKERDLEAQQDAGKRIGMDAGDDPAYRPEDYTKDNAKQDLHHLLEMRENGHKLTEMHTIICIHEAMNR